MAQRNFNPFDFNPEGHPDRTPKFDAKFDIVKQGNNPFGRGYDKNARPSPQSDKAPIIRGGSIPEIQDDIVSRDRNRMDKTFHDEEYMRRMGEIPIREQQRLQQQEEDELRQRENSIREMSELDRRTPTSGKIEGFPLPPPPGPEPSQNPFSPIEQNQRMNRIMQQMPQMGRQLPPNANPFKDPWWDR